MAEWASLATCAWNEAEYGRHPRAGPVSPLTEMASPVRTIPLGFDLLRRYLAVSAAGSFLASEPLAVLPEGLSGRAIFVMATGHAAIIRHHPIGIEALVDRHIFRGVTMMLFLSEGYGSERDDEGEKGENQKREKAICDAQECSLNVQTIFEARARIEGALGCHEAVISLSCFDGRGLMGEDEHQSQDRQRQDQIAHHLMRSHGYFFFQYVV